MTLVSICKSQKNVEMVMINDNKISENATASAISFDDM